MRKERTKSSARASARKATVAPDVKEATERYKEEFEDISIAVEAMRQARFVQEERVRHLLRPLGYEFFS